jgi:hypothetical protein
MTQCTPTHHNNKGKKEKKMYKEMLNIPGHKGNANQNHIKFSPHSSQNGYYQEHKQQMLTKMWGKGNPEHCCWEYK